MSKEIRRDRRVTLPGVILVSWHDARGELKVARGRCLDMSRSGLRVELPAPVALRSYVNVRAEAHGLSFSGSVRHCVRLGGKHIVGVEFSCPLKATDSRTAAALSDVLCEIS